MPLCVVVLQEVEEANKLALELRNNSRELNKVQLVEPSTSKEEANTPKPQGLNTDKNYFQSVKIDNVQLLNPKLSRKIRQKSMAFWLMPFGFITGLAFSKMTGLQTFSNLGVDPIAEPLIGSFLGMGSGLLGSYVASWSVNTDSNDDIRTLRKFSRDGLWLLILQTPLEIELPWALLKQSSHIQIIRLNDI